MVQIISEIAGWLDTANAHVSKSRTLAPEQHIWLSDEDKIDAFWKAILRVDDGNVEEVNWDLEFRTMLEQARGVAAKYIDNVDDVVALEHMLLIRVYRFPLLDRVSSLVTKQLFWTEDDRFGFTSRGVKLGDAVCVFGGAPLVHVVRRTERGGDQVEKWRLVGDAYVHGLMYGEANGMDVGERELCLV